MKRIKSIVPAVLLSAFAFVAISTMYAKTASASRYAVAYNNFGGSTCTGNPGNDCDHGGN
jgi:hypothetical protein